MNARERWQALQARLTAARGYADAGDRTSALREVDAALQLDPNFLAAHSLRERLMGPPDLPLSPPVVRPAADGYSQFEQRARRRRVDRRIDAARAAIARRRLKEAAAALDEVIELDPNLPELAALTASFDDLRRTLQTPHRGRWVAAAGAFAATLLAATLLEHTRPSLLSHSTTTMADLVETPPSAPPSVATVAAPAPTDAPDAVTPVDAEPVEAAPTPVAPPPPIARTVATSGALEREAPRTPPPALEPDRLVRTVEPRSEPEPVAPVIAQPAPAPPPPIVAAPPVAMPPVARASSDSIVIPPIAPNDDQLVRQALQRYRSAYEGLDAPSARAVYPAINEAALARAFDGLQSQTLTFDTCDVQLRGDLAGATCRGTARYVPKIGSREPRTEPRVWTFTLRRSGAEWRIDSARAER